MGRNVDASKRGFGWNPISKVLNIFRGGERHSGFAGFETLMATPTVAATAEIGQLAQDPMGGYWRYCKAGAAISNPLYGAGFYTQPDDCTAGVTAAGSMTLAVSALGTTTGTVTENQFANGTIIIGGMADTNHRRFYHIKSNTGGGTAATTLTLYHPVQIAILGTEWSTIVPNPWSDVRDMSAAAGYMSVVCFPLQTVTNAYYFWGKVRGPVFGVVYSTVPGAASNDRAISTAPADGSIRMLDEAMAATSTQHLGWLIPRTGSGSTYAGGDQTFMLQLE